jgi:hypothetical protein
VPANTLVVDTFSFQASGPSLGPSFFEIWAYGRRSLFLSLAPLVPWTTTGLATAQPARLVSERPSRHRRTQEEPLTDISAFDPPLATHSR